MSKPFKIGLIQMHMHRTPDENVAHAVAQLEKAAGMGVQVACLPELFRSHYFCQTQEANVFDLAEPFPGPSYNALSAVAKKTGMVIVGSLFEKRAPGLHHNTAVIFEGDGSQAGLYRKSHIPDDPLFFEKYYFTPGDTGFLSTPTRYGNIGTLICWDQWYPEAARLTALQGSNVIFYPTAIGWHPGEKAEYGAAQQDAWVTAQRAHAIANGVYVASVNRIGHEVTVGQGIEFWGHSFIADPFGRIIAQASDDKEEIITAIVDPALQEETRRNWPFLRDRRIDLYSGITKRYGK